MKKISVIIPAYNAEKLIRKAVESAIQFEEVDEVLLVEDGSTDKTLNECKQLEKEYNKVKVYRHPDGINKGAGASRNLGIRKAINEFIAFIDADDYFLPNRFDAERKIFGENVNVDGVYGAIGTCYYSDDAKVLFEKKSQPEILTVNKKIEPEELKYALLGMSKNYTGSAFFSLDAFTVKKSLIEKAGYFNEKLRLHQDTDLITKLAFLGTLVPGLIDTLIGIRGIHGNNRITSSNWGFDSRLLQFSELEKWLNKNIVGEEKAKQFVRKEMAVLQLFSNRKKLSQIKQLVKLLINDPYLLFVDREFNRLLKGVFGNTSPIKVFAKLKKIIFLAIAKKKVEKWEQNLYS